MAKTKGSKGASGSIEGFRNVNETTFIRERTPEDDAALPSDHPDTIVIFGWGDCLPKHVAKYSNGYRELYPHSRYIIVLSPIAQSVFKDLPERTESMMPVAKLFPAPSAWSSDANRKPGTESDSDSSSNENFAAPRILIQCMSNTGGITYADTLTAYRKLHGVGLPQQLVVYDSTPGSPFFSMVNLQRWSRAMTVGLGPKLPKFPPAKAAAQVACGAYLCGRFGVDKFVGREPAGVYATRAMSTPDLCPTASNKLYLYGTDDEIILPQDVEGFIKQSREIGYHAEAEKFEGSGHVGHMREHPERYWAAIANAWRNTLPEGHAEEATETEREAIEHAAARATAVTPMSTPLIGSEQPAPAKTPAEAALETEMADLPVETNGAAAADATETDTDADTDTKVTQDNTLKVPEPIRV